MTIESRSIILKKRPSGMPLESDFDIRHETLPSPHQGELLLRTKYVSVDPYMRNRMNNVKSYVEPYEINGILGGDAIAEVVASGQEDFRVGDFVKCKTGWQEYACITAGDAKHIPKGIQEESLCLGLLGLTGLTAYFGMLDVGKPVSGETVVISGAAGAVGMIAGQIAKLKGCRVIGITGSDEKVKFLKEDLGFDEALNYKTLPNLRKALMKVCTSGIDIYFDNVGGEVSDSIYYLINDHSRIILCGQISNYNISRLPTGPRLMGQVLIHRAMIKGFIVYDYANEFDTARDELLIWYKKGKVKSMETVNQGFENIIPSFLGLFKGENIGKMIVEI